MTQSDRKAFHIHLISDGTGETLNAVARAAAAYYSEHDAVEHVHTLVRTSNRLDRVFLSLEENLGIVLFTIVDSELRRRLEVRCWELNIPCISILDSVIGILGSYLHAPLSPRIGGQHSLDRKYFHRIDALNYTVAHDDGHHRGSYEDADVVILGISRTSKTPTCIYLANRGIKAANVPVTPEIAIPEILCQAKNPLIVGLTASVDRISQVRRNRLLSIGKAGITDLYARDDTIEEEIRYSREIFSRFNWPVIDVSRRSIEETAAMILNLLSEHHNKNGGIKKLEFLDDEKGHLSFSSYGSEGE